MANRLLETTRTPGCGLPAMAEPRIGLSAHASKLVVCTDRAPPRMSLDTTEKQQLINTHQTHGTDTGSAEVQVAMLSERINRLSSHLQNNIHDFSSRQGLLKMIGRRKRLLSYMRSKSEQRYADTIAKLGIRG